MSYDPTHEVEVQPRHTKDQHNDQPSNFIGFTFDKYKSLLALLQKSSQSSSHSVNYLTSKPKSNINIIYTLNHHVKLESFIIDP